MSEIRVSEELKKLSKEEWISEEVKTRIMNFLRQLQKISPNEKQIEEILPELYRRAVYSESFDNSMILLMKFAVAHFIIVNPDYIASYKLRPEELVNLLLNTSSVKNPNEYEIWKDIADVIYNGISAMLEVTLAIYPCQAEAEGIMQYKYSISLEGEDKDYPDTIEIMESPRGLLSILYSKDLHNSVISKYDKSINGKIITSIDQILQPTCCCKRFYKRAYYTEMIKIKGSLNKNCIACKGIIDDLSYSSLQEMEKSRLTLRLIFLALSIILVVGLMIYVISNA